MKQGLYRVFMAHHKAEKAWTLYKVFYALRWTALNFRSLQVTQNKYIGDLSYFSTKCFKVPS